MPVETSKTCPSCNESHIFLLTTADKFTGGAAYNFTCPKTKRAAEIVMPDCENGKIVNSKSPGAVIVRKV